MTLKHEHPRTNSCISNGSIVAIAQPHSNPHNNNDTHYYYCTERAVLKRFEERNRDRSLKGATSRLELEQATIAKMRNVTGAEEDVCIAILERHGYDVNQSVEAYLEGSLPN